VLSVDAIVAHSNPCAFVKGGNSGSQQAMAIDDIDLWMPG